MSQFIVSARKYRPGRFDEVVGQEHVTQTLKNAIRQNKVAHAFLFCGPRGVGKTTTARILAKTINCENISEDYEACGTCLSCLSFDKKNAPNIIELDAASNNSVEYIRTLNEQVRIPPAQGKYKLFIIDEVHMLSTSAFNAFLKTLEEPPPFAVFILATTEKHKIIPTILSRCQIYDFKRSQIKDILPHLEMIAQSEGLTYETEALHLIAEKADGALRDSLSIFDRIVSFTDGHITYDAVIDQLNILDHDYYFKLTDHLITGNLSEVYLLFSEILEKGFDEEIFLLGFQEHLRQLLMIHLGKTAVLTEASQQLKKRYAAQAQNTSRDVILTLLDLANQCDIHYRFAQNKRLHVEIALMKMAYAPYAVAVDQTTSTAPAAEADKKKIIREEADSYGGKTFTPEASRSVPSEDSPSKTNVDAVRTGEDQDALIPDKEDRVETRDESKTKTEAPVEEEIKPSPEKVPAETSAASTSGTSAESVGKVPRRKKKLLPTLDLADIKMEVEQDESAPPIEIDEEELFARVQKTWTEFLENHNSPSLVTYMKDAVLAWKDENIYITVTSQLARSSILDQRDLFEQMREVTEPLSPEFVFEIDQTAQPDQEKPQLLTTRDKYEALKNSNPRLDDLIQSLQLKIDSD